MSRIRKSRAPGQAPQSGMVLSSVLLALALLIGVGHAWTPPPRSEAPFLLQDKAPSALQNEDAYVVRGRVVSSEVPMEKLRVRWARIDCEEHRYAYLHGDAAGKHRHGRLGRFFDSLARDLHWPNAMSLHQGPAERLTDDGSFTMRLPQSDPKKDFVWRIELWWADDWEEYPIGEGAWPRLGMPIAFGAPFQPGEESGRDEAVMEVGVLPMIEADWDRDATPPTLGPNSGPTWRLALKGQARPSNLSGPFEGQLEGLHWGLWPESGPLRIPLPPQMIGQRLQLTLSARSLEAKSEVVTLQSPLTSFGRLRFPRAAQLKGVVIDSKTGDAVAGHTVFLSTGGEPGGGLLFGGRSSYGERQSDAQGRFEFSDLQPGEYTVHAAEETGPRLPTGMPQASKSFVVAEGEEKPLRLEIGAPITTFRIEIKDVPEDWESILFAFGEDSEKPKMVAAGRERQFEVRLHGNRKWTFVTTAEGAAAASAYVKLFAEWKPDGRSEVDLTLKPLPTCVEVSAPEGTSDTMLMVGPSAGKPGQAPPRYPPHSLKHCVWNASLPLPEGGKPRQLRGLMPGRYHFVIRSLRHGKTLHHWEQEVS